MGCRQRIWCTQDVLLGPADHYQWLETSSVSKKSFRRKYQFNAKVAREQHAEMISAYESAGVKVHLHAPDPALPYQIFARDSSVMTPFGAIITSMANWWRRGENYRAIETYERLGIPVYDYVTAGTFEGGDFNVIEPGAVLIGWEGEDGRSQEQSALQLKAWFEAEGWAETFHANGGLTIQRIGDCAAPGIIASAVYAGHKAARELGQDKQDQVEIKRDRVVVGSRNKIQ